MMTPPSEMGSEASGSPSVGAWRRVASVPDARSPDRHRKHHFCPAQCPQRSFADEVGLAEKSRPGLAGVLQEVRACLLCPSFIQNAERYPKGWHHFVAEHLESFLRTLLDDVLGSMEGFFQILNNLPDGLFTVDTKNRINYFSPSARMLTGLSSEEVIGRHCSEIFPNIECEFEFESPCGLDVLGRMNSKEFSITRTDGSVVPVISNSSLIWDHRGDVIGGVEVFKDITLRKKLEDELRKSEEKYRMLFEGSRDMILMISSDHRIKDVNPAGVEMLGYTSKEDLLSVGWSEELFGNPLHSRVFHKQINRWGFIKDFETFFKTRDGDLIHCLLSGSAVKDRRGQVIRYQGIAKDITARMDAVKSLQQRHRELSLLNSIALTMNATQDLDTILDTALEKVLAVLAVRGGAFVMIDHRRATLNLKALRGLPDSVVAEEGRLVLLDDLLMESLFKPDLSLAPVPVFPPFKARLEMASGNSAPELTCFLINGKEKARGFLALDIPGARSLTDQDLALLGSLANFLGGAIENARLHQTIRRHGEELRELTAELFNSQELERKRIARELHDEAGQALTGINLALEAVEKKLSTDMAPARDLIADVKRQVNHTYSEMRRLSHRLHPALLSDMGLEAALEAYFTRIARHSELGIEFRVVGFEERPVQELETALYRLSQEALSNTLKHSGAKQFKLSIIKSYPDIIFSAEDDGDGFDAKEVRESGQSLGLVSMRERAAMLGGSFNLRTSKGSGTHIRITIPVQERRP